jgi:hypothetical protein
MKSRLVTVAVILASIVATTVGSGVATAKASDPTHYRFFERQTSFTTSSGRIEFTSLDYSGDHGHHANHWTATDHFVCAFAGSGAPVCDGQVSIGESMVLVHGAGGEGNFSIPVAGGTGTFVGVHGTMRVQNLPHHSENSDIDITFTR